MSYVYNPADPMTLPQINIAHAMRAVRKKAVEEYSRSPGLHVSELGQKHALSCDRFLQFGIEDVPRTASSSMRWLQSRFEVGHAFHDWAYASIERAITDHLEATKQKFRLIELKIEESIGLDRYYITGTPDAVATLEYIDDPGKHFRIVIDVKSVSKKNFEKYMKTGGMSAPLVYRHQVQIYMARLQAHLGLIYWVMIEQPFAEEQTVVMPEPRVYENLGRRVDVVIDRMNEGLKVPLSVGPHCRECPYLEHCESTRAT